MSGILVKNDVINAGNIPFISSGPNDPLTLGREFVDNELYYWTDAATWWGYSSIYGGWNNLSNGIVSALTLQDVLNNGNVTDLIALFRNSITGDTTQINTTGVTVGNITSGYGSNMYSDRVGVSKAGAGYVTIDNTKIKFYDAVTNFVINIYRTGSITKNVNQYLLIALGNVLVGDTGRVTLTSGAATVTVGANVVLTTNSTFQFSVNNPSGTLGVAYQGVYSSPTTFRVYSLTALGAVNSLDLSTLDWTVISV